MCLTFLLQQHRFSLSPLTLNIFLSLASLSFCCILNAIKCNISGWCNIAKKHLVLMSQMFDLLLCIKYTVAKKCAKLTRYVYLCTVCRLVTSH